LLTVADREEIIVASDVVPILVFCSYAREDKPLLEKLEVHLSMLKRQELISTWHEGEIVAGRDRVQVINERIEQASIILLLVSPDYLASDHLFETEMQRAIERHETGQARVIPLIVRPCDWQHTPLNRLQALPPDARPISLWANKDEAWMQVTAGLRRVIEDLSLLPASTSRSVLPSIWTIPYPRNPFFLGRDELLAQIHTQFQTGEVMTRSQPQAISGLGGIGKTQLVIEYAYRYSQEYQVVLWAQAESIETLNASYAQLAVKLHLPEKEAEKQEIIVEAVKTWLQYQHRWLLILDNVENPQEILTKFVPPRHQGCIMMTTRVHNVAPLAQTQVLSTMSEQEGVLFLLRRTMRIASKAGLEEASPEQYGEAKLIWQLMDGLPLALDQTGAYIVETGCSFATYCEQYTNRSIKLLQRRGKRFIGHEMSVATTFSLALERVEEINPMAADILQICTLLHGEAIPDEIFQDGAIYLGPCLANNLDDWDEAVGILLDYSLVQRNTEAHTLTIHNLVQTVLKDMMAEEEEIYESLAQQVVLAVSESFPPGDHATWKECERLLPQVFACSTLIKEDWTMTSEDGWGTLLKAARLFSRTGGYLYHRAQYSSAEQLLKQALQIRSRLQGKKHASTISSQNDLAMLYCKQGRYTDAEPLLKQVLEIVQKRPKGNMIFPQLEIQYVDAATRWQYEYSDIALALNNLATLYLDQGKYAEAEPLLKQVLELYREQWGIENSEAAACLNNLAEVYRRQRMYEEAEPLFDQALTIIQKTRGMTHPETAQCLNNLATFYLNIDNQEKAEQLYKEAIQIYQQPDLGEHPDTALSLNNLANLYKEQGKYAEAEPLYLRALSLLEKQLGASHPRTRLVRSNYASLLRSMGRDEDASRQEEPS
jgi:tetratricopeptide (TPR) repeat protein